MAVLINFHIIFLIPKHDEDRFEDCLNLESILFREVLSEWKRNIASRGHPVYQPLCTFVRKFVRGKLRTNYDLHYVNPILSDGGTANVAFYVLKYMMKPSNRAVRLQQALHMNLPEDEYEDVWKVVRPRHFESEGFGFGVSDTDSSERMNAYHKVIQHLRKGLDASKRPAPGCDPVPSFYSPFDGKAVPLAKYYKSNPLVMDMSDYLDFFYASKKVGDDNVIVHDDVHVSQLIKSVDDFEKRVRQLDARLSATDLDDLFEQ